MKKEQIERKNLTLRLNKELEERLKKKANKLGISKNAAISLAVSNYIKTQ